MRLTSGCVLLVSPLMFAAAIAQQQTRAIEVSDPGWTLSGDIRVARVLGRQSLRCGSGTAYFPAGRLRNGAIEFDVATTKRRTFVGVRFRAASEQVWEEIYFRPHKAGLPDAIQYAPAFADAVSNWQLYHGPGDTAAVEFRPERWTRVKVLINGDRAAVFFDKRSTPDMVSQLAHGPREGFIGFWCLDASDPKTDEFAAAISNVVIDARAVDFDVTIQQPSRAPSGVIAGWAVSSAFAAPASGPVRDLPQVVLGGEWRPAQSEPSGVLAFDRFVARPAGGRRVAAAARVTIHADRAQVAPFDLGYSDDVSVFLNGALLYSGVNGYSYNFPRRDGLITIDQSTVSLPLTAGANELVVVVSEAFGGWGLMGRLVDRAGLTVTR